MHIPPIVGVVVIFVAGCGRHQPAAVTAESPDAVRAIIQAKLDSMTAAALRNDVAAVVGWYTDNARFVRLNAPDVVGRPGLLAFFAPDTAGVLCRDGFIRTDEVHVAGALAAERGSNSFTCRDRPGAPWVRTHGKYVQVWRREPPGPWLIEWDMTIASAPPDTVP